MAKQNNVFKRGDVVYAALGNYPDSSRQSGDRPCVVVSNTRNNAVSQVMTVCPISTRIKNNPVHIRITPDDVRGYFPKESDIMVEQITTIDKRNIVSKYGCVEPEILKQVDEIICKHLGLVNQFEDKEGSCHDESTRGDA